MTQNDPIQYQTPPDAAPASSQLRALGIVHFWAGVAIILWSLFITRTAFQFFAQGGHLGDMRVSVSDETLVAIGAAAVILGWTLGTLTIVSGRRIAQHRSRGFSIIIAAVNCVWFPFGTLLGIYTIAVLTKDATKRLY